MLVGLLDSPEAASISSPGTRAADASMATGGGAGTEAGAIAAERAQPQSPPASPAQGAAASESVARSLALDGPTASGKSAVGRALAERLGFGFLDTGMMYRACTRAVFDAGIDPEDGDAVIARVRTASLDVTWPDPATPRVSVDGADVTDGLREPAIEASVSLILAPARGARRDGAPSARRRRARPGGDGRPRHRHARAHRRAREDLPRRLDRGARPPPPRRGARRRARDGS